VTEYFSIFNPYAGLYIVFTLAAFWQ